jgi:hypothetical protein
MNPYSTEDLDVMLLADPERAIGLDAVGGSLGLFHWWWSWGWLRRH